VSTTPEPPFFVYLDRVEILAIHLAVLNPGELEGVLHPDQVDAAVARPQRSAFGVDAFPTLRDKAACLLHSIARIGHPFADGNHRTAARAAVTFLRLNGVSVDLDMKVNETERFVWDVGDGVYDGETEIQDIAAILQTYAVPLDEV
jgi:death on curing protein